MPSSQHAPSFLFSAAPRWALHCWPVDRKHSFPSGRWSQISAGPCGPLSQLAHSSFPVRSVLHVPSRLSREAWPRSRRALPGLAAFVQCPAFSSFLVMLPRWAVAPWRHQLALANSLSVNWYTFSYLYFVVGPPRFIQAFSVISPSRVRQTPLTRHRLPNKTSRNR